MSRFNLDIFHDVSALSERPVSSDTGSETEGIASDGEDSVSADDCGIDGVKISEGAEGFSPSSDVVVEVSPSDCSADISVVVVDVVASADSLEDSFGRESEEFDVSGESTVGGIEIGAVEVAELHEPARLSQSPFLMMTQYTEPVAASVISSPFVTSAVSVFKVCVST